MPEGPQPETWRPWRGCGSWEGQRVPSYQLGLTDFSLEKATFEKSVKLALMRVFSQQAGHAGFVPVQPTLGGPVVP